MPLAMYVTVRMVGVEPTSLAALGFESSAFTSFATLASKMRGGCHTAVATPLMECALSISKTSWRLSYLKSCPGRSDGVHVSVTGVSPAVTRISTPRRTRTDTETILSRLPLPIGIEGQAGRSAVDQDSRLHGVAQSHLPDSNRCK
jgi:hypothetical protein